MKRLISGLLASLMCAFSVTATATEGQIGADEAYAAFERGELLIIDVRTSAEWRETGIPKGAKTVEFAPVAFQGKVLEIVAANKSQPIALICRSGNRSTKARDALTGSGFTNVLNIKEGMSGSSFGPGWLNRGLPISSCANCY